MRRRRRSRLRRRSTRASRGRARGASATLRALCLRSAARLPRNANLAWLVLDVLPAGRPVSLVLERQLVHTHGISSLIKGRAAHAPKSSLRATRRLAAGSFSSPGSPVLLRFLAPSAALGPSGMPSVRLPSGRGFFCSSSGASTRVTCEVGNGSWAGTVGYGSAEKYLCLSACVRVVCSVRQRVRGQLV